METSTPWNNPEVHTGNFLRSFSPAAMAHRDIETNNTVAKIRCVSIVFVNLTVQPTIYGNGVCSSKCSE